MQRGVSVGLHARVYPTQRYCLPPMFSEPSFSLPVVACAPLIRIILFYFGAMSKRFGCVLLLFTGIALRSSYRQVHRLDREVFVSWGGPDLLVDIRG